MKRILLSRVFIKLVSLFVCLFLNFLNFIFIFSFDLTLVLTLTLSFSIERSSRKKSCHPIFGQASKDAYEEKTQEVSSFYFQRSFYELGFPKPFFPSY